MDLDEKSKEETERNGIEEMIHRAINNDIKQRFFKPLRDLV